MVSRFTAPTLPISGLVGITIYKFVGKAHRCSKLGRCCAGARSGTGEGRYCTFGVGGVPNAAACRGLRSASVRMRRASR